MEVSTYDNDFQITKETFDKDSNLSIAADALQQPGSCRIYSSGVLFTLKSNYQQNLQINSIDIFTTAKIPIHFDIWVSRGNQTNQFYAEDMTFHNWTKCCCDSPVMGKGSKLPTNIPFNIMLQFGGYDVISLLIKTQNTNTDIISSAFGCSGFDPTLPSGKGNKYLDINLEATVSEGSKKNTHYHPEQLIWNGAMNFEVYSQNLDMKEGNATSKYLGLYHHHEILSLNHNVEERRLQPCRFNQQLTTPTEGTTASYGIMFDIVPLNDLVLETIEFHCRKDRGELFNYEVYAKAGGHSNFETDQNKWTSISEGALHVAGWEKFTGIPNDEFTRITMKAGEVYSLYLASNSSDILYGTGLEVGRINAADSNMQILEGLSMAAFPPFSDDIFSPRTFQGRVHYSTATECSEILESTNVAVTRMPTISPTLAPTPCASEYLASTTFTGTSASFGIMFEATSKERDLLVEGFQVRSSKVAGSLLKYTIYSKEDSYRRFETNPNAWEVISDGFTTSEGRETLTTLSIDRSLGINIQPSIVRAFYITFATPDLLYSIGEDEGTMFLSDDNIELYEGIGIAEYPPFGTSFMIPRRYEGVVQYFIEEDCSDKAIEPSFSPTSPILASNMPTSSSTEPQTSIPSTNANDSESPTGSPFAQVENLIISQSSSPPTPTSVESNTQNTPQPTISMTNKTTSSFPTEQPSKPILNGTFNERTAPTAKTNPTRPSNLTNNSDSGGELSTMGHFSSSGSLSGVNISSTGNKPTCNLLNDLNTTTNGNLSSFGNIFEVRVASQSLIVETIGFMSNKPIGTGLNYSIFFKEGSFRQFESDSSKWSKNSEGNVISEGNTNMTQIPYGNFEPILLDANTSYSFYFILDSPDVMYDIRKSEDRPYLFDEHLEVVEGTNVENHPPFESYTFSGNLWIGSIVYSIQAECIVPSTSPLSLLEPSNSSLGNTLAILTPSSNPSLSNSEVESFPSFNLEFEKEKIMEPVEKIHSISINFTDIVSDDTPNSGLSSKFLNNEENTTSVTLKFLIENTFMNEIQSDFIIAQINEAMEESVSNMIATDSSFIQYAEDFNLELRSVTSEMNHILKDHELDHCLSYLNEIKCSIINVAINVAHSEKITNGQVRYSILSGIDEINADFNSDISMIYIGSKAEITQVEMVLIGKNLNLTWRNDTKLESILDVIRSETLQVLSFNDDFEDIYISDLEIMDVYMISESMMDLYRNDAESTPQENELSNRQRVHIHESLTKLGVHLNIKSEHVPKTSTIFDDAIFAAMRNIEHSLVSEISAYQDLNQILDIKLTRYEINQKIPTDYDTTHNTSQPNISNATKQGEEKWNLEIILTIALSSAFILGLAFAIGVKRRKNQKWSGRSIPIERTNSFSVSSVMRRNKEVWSRRDIEDLQYKRRNSSGSIFGKIGSSKTLLSFR